MKTKPFIYKFVHRVRDERKKEYERVTKRQKFINLRKKAVEKLGNKCVKCGFSDYRALQIDHVHGGGKKDRSLRNPIKIIREVLVDKENKYQLLCANCNWIKIFENREIKPCPKSKFVFRKMAKVPVILFKDGIKLKIYPSVLAGAKDMKITPLRIFRNLKGKTHDTDGYIWKKR